MADYLPHLHSKGKGEWPGIAEDIWHNHIEPAFGKWSLASLSRSPAENISSPAIVMLGIVMTFCRMALLAYGVVALIS